MNVSLRLPMLTAAALLLLIPATGCNKLKARDQLNKGVQAYKSARFEEAVEHFQNAISLDPDLKTAKLFLATAYASQVVPDVKMADNIKNANNAISSSRKSCRNPPATSARSKASALCISKSTRRTRPRSTSRR